MKIQGSGLGIWNSDLTVDSFGGMLGNEILNLIHTLECNGPSTVKTKVSS